MSEKVGMSENEAIIRIARGIHPTNLFDASVLLGKFDDFSTNQQWLESIPRSWDAFRRLAVNWLRENGYQLSPSPTGEIMKFDLNVVGRTETLEKNVRSLSVRMESNGMIASAGGFPFRGITFTADQGDKNYKFLDDLKVAQTVTLTFNIT